MTRAALSGFLSLLALFLPACAGCEEQEPPFSDVTPQLSTSVDRIDLGAVYVGAVRITEFNLESTGTAAVIVSDIVVEGAGLTLRSTAPGRLTPGSTATVVVSFAPGAEGVVDGRVTISHDAPTGAQTVVAIVGEGRFPPDCDDGNPCTDRFFDIEQEECVTIFLTTDCDDDNACTTGDRCVQGECFGQALTCEDDGIACTLGVCDPQEGCIQIPRDSLCEDDNPCTNDICDVDSGCENPPKAEFSPCGDVVDCVSIDLCIQQACRTVPIPEGAPCDDLDVCTTGETCQAGFCEGTRIDLPPTLIGENRLLRLDQVQASIHTSHGQRRIGDDGYLVLLEDGAAARIAPLEAPLANGATAYGLSQVYRDLFAYDVVTLPEENRAVFGMGNGAVTMMDFSDVNAPVEQTRVASSVGANGISGMAPDLIARCSGDDASAIELISVTPTGLLEPTVVALDAPRCDFAASVFVTANFVVLVRPQAVIAYPRTATLDVGAVRVFPLPELLGLLNISAFADAATDYILVRGETPATSTPRLIAIDLTEDDANVVEGSQVLSPGTFSTVVLLEDSVLGFGGGQMQRLPRDLSAEPVVIGSPSLLGFTLHSGDRLVTIGDREGAIVVPSVGAVETHPILGLTPTTQLAATPSALWLHGPQSLVRMDRDEVSSGQHPTTIATPGFSTESITLLDLPSGPAGAVAVIEDADSNGHRVGHCGSGDCSNFGLDSIDADSVFVHRLSVDEQARTTLSEVGRLDVETFLIDREILASSEQEIEIVSIDVKGCAVGMVAAVEFGDLFRVAVVIGDRCSLGGGIVLLQALQLPGTFHLARGDTAPRVRIHTGTVLSVALDLEVHFIDFADPVLPTNFGTVQLPTPLDSNEDEDVYAQWASIDVGFQPGHFAIALTGNHAFGAMETQDQLLVGTIAGDFVITGNASLSLTDDDDAFAEEENRRYRPRRRVLALMPPRVYVGTTVLDEERRVHDAVAIYALDAPNLELDQEVVLATEPTDAIIEDGNIYVGRVDGASMVSPPCGPSLP